MKITPAAVFDFKAAQPDDLPLVIEILAEAAAWLKEKGIDQWPSPPNEHWQRRMTAAIERKEMYTVGVDQNRFGILRFTWPDLYWPDDNLAGYVHSMAVRPTKQGKNIGGAILSWAALKARQMKNRRFERRLVCEQKSKSQNTCNNQLSSTTSN